MAEPQTTLSELTQRVQELAQQHNLLSKELIAVIDELEALKNNLSSKDLPIAPQYNNSPQRVAEDKITISKPLTSSKKTTIGLAPKQTMGRTEPKVGASEKPGLEAFIGKNLASRIGILITLIGIFIGARYAFEQNLVSPLVRILLGYSGGGLLILFALRLRKSLESYSAILMGGGLSVLYFITYIAYSFYSVFSPSITFVLMLLITAGSVFTALKYNRVLVAHLAQIGALAIPFLIGGNSGRFLIFLGYIAFIDTGILMLSYFRKWKSLYHTAYILTWFIFGLWYVLNYEDELLPISLGFSTIYFLFFYAMFLLYKLVRREIFTGADVWVVLSNVFIYYTFGFLSLYDRLQWMTDLIIFTLCNAALHALVAAFLFFRKGADRSVAYLVGGLALVFVTVLIPVQFDGDWVTFLWTMEALLICLIGIKRRAAAYCKIGAVLLLLAFFSLLQDWFVVTNKFYAASPPAPFLNYNFLFSLLTAFVQGFILYQYLRGSVELRSIWKNFFTGLLPVLFLLTAYCTFAIQLNGYFEIELYKYTRTGNLSYINDNKILAILSFSLLFLSVAVLVNGMSLRRSGIAKFLFLVFVVTLAITLFAGLPLLQRLSFAYRLSKEDLHFGSLNMAWRYCIPAFTFLCLYFSRKFLLPLLNDVFYFHAWNLLLHLSAICFISAEYLYLSGERIGEGQYRLGLSIVWGIYALLLVSYGIWKKQKLLRVAAITLLAITLVKLFVYDLAASSTLTRTITFISLGAILLLVSYLYNRNREIK